MSKHTGIKLVFFGTPELATFVLDELKKGGILPSLIVTAPDRPVGRGMKLTSPQAKVWAEENFISTFQPETLKDEDVLQVIKDEGPWDLFIVAVYGKIIPKEILEVPKHGTLNVHPSLLPKYRGPAPIESTILSGDNETGVSIILLDEEMDRGDIVESKKLKVESFNKEELGEKLFRIGGKMLEDIIPKWIAKEIKATPQENEKATYTKKITKEDGLIDLNDDGEINWSKFRAYYGWPGTHFFTKKGIRIKITDAIFEKGKFIIKKVVPEGKKEIDYDEFLKNYLSKM